MGGWRLLLGLLALAACSATKAKPCTGKQCAAGGTGGVRSSGVAKGRAGAGGSDPFGNTNTNPSSVALADASVATTSASGPICADVELQADRVIPTVILVIDQSGSMNDQFGNTGSRWNVLRDFLLLDPNGLISDLQSQVRFGLAMYSAKSDGNGQPVGECPLVSSIAPALDNYASIAQAYRAAEPIDDTPTGDAIDKVLDGLALNMPDHVGSTALILATDGEPDRCEELDPQTPTAQQESIAAVTRAYSMGVRTFIISVGNEVGKQHQQDVANAGVGHKAGDPDAMYWQAGDDKTLRDA